MEKGKETCGTKAGWLKGLCTSGVSGESLRRLEGWAQGWLQKERPGAQSGLEPGSGVRFDGSAFNFSPG